MCLWTVIWGLRTSIRGIRPAVAFTTNGAARILSHTISKRSTMAKGSPSGHTTAKILRRRPWRGLRHIPRLFWGVLQTLRIRRSVSARGWGNLRRTSGATPRRAAVPRLRARSPSTTPALRAGACRRPRRGRSNRRLFPALSKAGATSIPAAYGRTIPMRGCCMSCLPARRCTSASGYGHNSGRMPRGVQPPIRHVWMRRRP